MPPLNQELDRMLENNPLPVDSGWAGHFLLHADFTGFSGHFPEYPILPAFIQVQMAVHLLGRALGRSLRLARIGTAKFTGQARPGDRLSVECAPFSSARDGDGWECLITKGDTTQVAKFRLHFKA